MNQTTKMQSPNGVHSVTPHLICDGAAKAIDFYVKAFGATEMVRLPGPNGKLMHACISVNGSSVMLVDEDPMGTGSAAECGMQGPKSLRGTPVSIHLIVDDADGFVERAVSAGATIVMPVEDAFWGDRFGLIEDPFGHRWSVATPQRHMTEAEIRDAAKTAILGQ